MNTSSNIGQPHLFTIIVPTYNRPKLLLRCVESVLNQDFGDFEIIVVDDGSQIMADEVLAPLADDRIKVLRQENKGKSAARNLGLFEASGKFLIFLDDDDYFLPKHLSTLAGRILVGEQTLILTGSFYQSENSDELGKQPFQYPLTLDRLITEGLQLIECCIPSNVAKSHTFDESLPYGQDLLYLVEVLASATAILELESRSTVVFLHSNRSVNFKDRKTLLRRSRSLNKITKQLNDLRRKDRRLSLGAINKRAITNNTILFKLSLWKFPFLALKFGVMLVYYKIKSFIDSSLVD